MLPIATLFQVLAVCLTYKGDKQEQQFKVRLGSEIYFFHFLLRELQLVNNGELCSNEHSTFFFFFRVI